MTLGERSILDFTYSLQTGVVAGQDHSNGFNGNWLSVVDAFRNETLQLGDLGGPTLAFVGPVAQGFANYLASGCLVTCVNRDPHHLRQFGRQGDQELFDLGHHRLPGRK